MHIWLLKDGEHLPVQGDVRPMRMWLLAKALRDLGHQVTWWASTFSHQRKQLLADRDTESVADGIRLKLLHAGAYGRNVSLARFRHHRRLARAFAEAARREPTTPDVIVAAFPILEFAQAGVHYAATRAIPSLVDIRDLWPDVFVDKAPTALRPLVSMAVSPLERTAKQSLQGATALVGVSPSYLEWGLDRAGRVRTEDDAVFYLGCDDPGRVAVDRPRDGRITCVFVGSFGMSYELDLVCDAALLVHQSLGESVEFVLAGAGDQYERIAKRAEGLPNVTLRGWVGRAEVRQLLASADVGLSPVVSISHPSTLSNKIFEYLAFGLPIVSSVEGETTELLERHDVGIAYPRGNARALADAVIRLASDGELRRRQSAKARELFEQRFRADDIYERYAHHVETVASRSASGSPS